MTLDILPESIARDGESAIVITWTDGQVSRLTARELRQACPCATCREKKRADEKADEEPSMPLTLPVLKAEEARPLTITSMKPVGSYAYNIAFSDGHSSGLYPMKMLYELGR
ncbi:hypothetical protein Mal15_00170 [Stieleria maiorica]|uniref:Gamma-butyrobetaine hydroxylase-like N-terminal domain-containing protein n=1 Tax=Stieleria maiorica TaxID=2795974 RepID=A0A5B9M4E4_9BACT|nr:DUF971 domain-containing protein [Stieleria maiorica]QEF95991.1 hypothetical protein Mal15_00170 [Stieleria maiorica]